MKKINFYRHLLLIALLSSINIATAKQMSKLTPSSHDNLIAKPVVIEKIDGLKNQYIAICYHDVRDDVVPLSDPDRYAVSTAELARQFEWLAINGYQPVSLDQIITASEGGKPLPDNAVLLTFDDGYASFYTHIFPLLKTYQYPAVFAIVTSWVQMPKHKEIDVGHKKLTHNDFLTWAQIKEMSDSGLVSFASHTNDMHKAILANAQGNVQPAAVIPQYYKKQQRYETPTEYEQRIYDDLKRSSNLLYRHTGKRPRAVVWPYGRKTNVAEDIAKSLGMVFSMTLQDKSANDVNQRRNIQRWLMTKNIPISTYAYQIDKRQKNALLEKGEKFDFYQKEPDIQRIVQVDLDYVYDPDPKQVDKNLSQLLDRIKRMQISTVYLQAFSDTDADGGASSLYFPNNHLPVRMDLFNRVAWQIKTRANANVYAWLPVMAFQLPNKNQQKELQLSPADSNAHIRLDITKPRAREIITDIYRSLAFHNEIDGILFHDDAYFREDELMQYTASEKTDLILDFTDALTHVFKQYRPNTKTARNLFANVVLNPDSEQWFAQNFDKFLQHYDYTAIMAMPYMEKAEKPKRWLKKLVHAVKAHPKGLEKTIFELQAFDWDKKQKIDSQHLANKMQWLLEEGALNYGYYPDDFIQDHPKVEVIRPQFSLSTTPFPE